MMKKNDPRFRDIADIEEFERTPFEQRLAGMRSCYDVIMRTATAMPQSIAMVFLPDGKPGTLTTEVSYRELIGKITQTANAFQSLGIERDCVVSYVLPNLVQTHYVLWGAMTAGIVNPVNPLLEADHLVHILKAAETEVLVTLGPSTGKEIWHKVAALIDRVPTLHTVLCLGGIDGIERTNFKPELLSFDDFVNAQSADRLVSSRRIEANDMAAYFHTGGTTGVPKIAQLTHQNFLTNTLAIDKREPNAHPDTILCGLPLFHINGVMVTGLLPFSCGDRVILMSPSGFRDKTVIENIWSIVERYQANLLSGVPTVYAAALGVPVNGFDISSLRFGICGAAPMPPMLLANFERLTGVQILEGYGLTEGTCVSSINPRDGERRTGSIGLRLPYQKMKTIRLKEKGVYAGDCAIGEIGHVVIKGPNLFAGYKRQSDNAGIWVEDGWFDTGDLGRQDQEGYFWLTGREKELIIRGGHNIDPAMIEDALSKHPHVHMSAAVGKPDAHAGELPVAYVALKPGTALSPETLLTFARETISERAAIPIEIFIVDALPITAVGKIFKPALRQQAAQRVFTEKLKIALPEYGHIKVQVSPHEVYGSFATVHIENIKDRQSVQDAVDGALSPFNIRYTLA